MKRLHKVSEMSHFYVLSFLNDTKFKWIDWFLKTESSLADRIWSLNQNMCNFEYKFQTTKESAQITHIK
jgi:hypothetical protein